MGAHIGPKRDLHLYDVPRPELVQQVAGVRPERPAGHALLKDAGFKAVQRLVLADSSGRLVAGLWPGELMPNARYLYSEHRAEAFVDAAEANGWSVLPNPHIGFWQAPPTQRLYMKPTLGLRDYVELWEGAGRDRIGGYSPHDLAESLWPWLKEQGCATDADDRVFGEFLMLLTSMKRDAHMRAGLYAKHEWTREEVGALSKSELIAAVRAALNRVLQAIGEPRLPVG
jgi:hypothetical protein